MKRALWVVFIVALMITVAWAGEIVCALHYNAPCYSTGQYRNFNGRGFVLYRCTCGDEYWVP
jgi:hypothetical protein